MTIKFRKGDKVSVIGEVTHSTDDGDDHVFVRLPSEFKDAWLPADGLTLVEAQFEEGDSVTWTWETTKGDGRRHGTILSIQEGHAWISLGGGDYCTRTLTSITRVFHEEIPA